MSQTINTTTDTTTRNYRFYLLNRNELWNVIKRSYRTDILWPYVTRKQLLEDIQLRFRDINYKYVHETYGSIVEIVRENNRAVKIAKEEGAMIAPSRRTIAPADGTLDRATARFNKALNIYSRTTTAPTPTSRNYRSVTNPFIRNMYDEELDLEDTFNMQDMEDVLMGL